MQGRLSVRGLQLPKGEFGQIPDTFRMETLLSQGVWNSRFVTSSKGAYCDTWLGFDTRVIQPVCSKMRPCITRCGTSDHLLLTWGLVPQPDSRLCYESCLCCADSSLLARIIDAYTTQRGLRLISSLSEHTNGPETYSYIHIIFMAWSALGETSLVESKNSGVNSLSIYVPDIVVLDIFQFVSLMA